MTQHSPDAPDNCGCIELAEVLEARRQDSTEAT